MERYFVKSVGTLIVATDATLAILHSQWQFSSNGNDYHTIMYEVSKESLCSSEINNENLMKI